MSSTRAFHFLPVGFSAQHSVVLIALLGGCLTGCGNSANTQSIHGAVTFRGQPFPKGSATFFPTSGRPVSTAVSDGNYEVELEPGEYTVVFSIAPDIPPGFKEGDLLPPPKIVLPPEYSVRAKSKLTLTVGDSGSQEQNFDLK